jgi:glucan 1,3-beta-glucosidase
MTAMNTPFFVGVMQPWECRGLELGGVVARATFDTYANLGWAAAAWSYKIVSNSGGHSGGQGGTWGMVTNAAGESIPALDFNTAPLADIEGLFKRFGTVKYQPHQPLRDWMTSSTAPDPFGAD